MKLNYKLALLVLMATVTTGFILGSWISHQSHQVLYADARQHGVAIAQSLAESQVSRLTERQLVDLTHAFRRIVKDNPELSYLYVTDFNGKVFAYSFDGGFPHEYLKPNINNREIVFTERRLPFAHVLEVDRPIIPGMPAHIYVGLDVAPIMTVIASTRLKIFTAALSIGILVALLVSLFTSRIIRPIHDLASYFEDYGRGGEVTRTINSESSSSKEIASLYDKFFQMIEERKAVLGELHGERNFINAILENAAALVVVLDRNGKIIRFNPAAENLSGYSSEEVTGRYVWDFLLLPEERDEVREQAFLALKNNPQTMVGTYSNYWLSKNGDKYLIEWSNSLLLDSHNKMEYMIAIGIDVTQREQSELNLQHFKSTLDRTLDCVFMFDAETLRFFYVNQGAIEQVGYGFEEMMQMHPYDIKPEISEVKFKEIIQPLLKGDKSTITFETLHQHRDGHDIPVEISLQYIKLVGEKPRFIAVVRDITERKRTEEQLQRLNQELEVRVQQRTMELEKANVQLTETLNTLQRAQDELVRSEKLASLGSLVAGVAHEMSTPLGNSLMVSSTLQDNVKKLNQNLADQSLSPEDLDEFVKRTTKATDLLNKSLLRASEMINHFKQVAVDQTSAKRREFDMAEMISEVLDTLKPRFKKTRHQIQFDPSACVRMDSYPGPLGQVVTNLVLNSLVHGFDAVDKNGTVIVNISELDTGLISVTISDDGTGIPEQDIPHVFDPFFTTKLGQGGSGLGLHIVYTIVTRILGGKIAVESKNGSGTKFTIEIPRVAPVQAQTEQSADARYFKGAG